MMRDKLDYIYSGTFNNLINVIGELIEKNFKPNDIKREDEYQNNLFSQVIKLNIDESEDKIIKIKREAKPIYDILYAVFLSCDEHKELIIYYFLFNAKKYGLKVLYLRRLKCVSEALRIAKYVHNEAHKMKGFLRFQQLKSKWYFAVIKPTNNVLPLIIKHFQKRMPLENWLIVDKGRNLLAINYHNHSYLIKANLQDIKIILDKDEEKFSSLWCSFFETVAIKERENKKCQSNFMPKKYWQYIIEMRSSNEKSYK